VHPGRETSMPYFSCSCGPSTDLTNYTELMFFHPVGSRGHVVHFGASGVQNIDALFFLLGWTWCGFHKELVGTRYTEVVFLHPV
jgi:hypothetical protein